LEGGHAIGKHQAVGLVLQQGPEHLDQVVGLWVVHGDLIDFGDAQHGSLAHVWVGIRQRQLQRFDQILIELGDTEAAHGSDCECPE
jgi:hypothetical protein